MGYRVQSGIRDCHQRQLHDVDSQSPLPTPQQQTGRPMRWEDGALR